MEYTVLVTEDTSGRFIEKYTAWIQNTSPYCGCFYEALGMSEDPEHPQGISEFGNDIYPQDLMDYLKSKKTEKRLGEDIPEHIKKHIIARLQYGDSEPAQVHFIKRVSRKYLVKTEV